MAECGALSQDEVFLKVRGVIHHLCGRDEQDIYPGQAVSRYLGVSEEARLRLVYHLNERFKENGAFIPLERIKLSSKVDELADIVCGLLR